MAELIIERPERVLSENGSLVTNGVARVLKGDYMEIQERQRRQLAFQRKQTILANAYPAYPTRNFSELYANVVFEVLPDLLREKLKGNRYGGSHLETRLRRLNGWINGDSVYEIARDEHVVSGTIRMENWKFPGYLGRKVSYYDLVHAADQRMDELEPQLDLVPYAPTSIPENLAT